MREVFYMDKKDILACRILVIGTILLFLGASLPLVISAVDINRYYLKDEPVDKSQKETADNHKEIVTFLFGQANIDWVKRRGFFRGEVNLTGIPNPSSKGPIFIVGYRFFEDGIEYYYDEVDDVYAYRFTGISINGSQPQTEFLVMGIALGNIDI